MNARTHTHRGTKSYLYTHKKNKDFPTLFFSRRGPPLAPFFSQCSVKRQRLKQENQNKTCDWVNELITLLNLWLFSIYLCVSSLTIVLSSAYPFFCLLQHVNTHAYQYYNAVKPVRSMSDIIFIHRRCIQGCKSKFKVHIWYIYTYGSRHLDPYLMILHDPYQCSLKDLPQTLPIHSTDRNSPIYIYIYMCVYINLYHNS